MNRWVIFCLGVLSIALCVAQTSTLFVSDRTVDCSTGGPIECFQIKKSKKAKWELLSTPIKGFQYKTGYEYKLKVTTDSAGKYELVKVCQKKTTKYSPTERLENSYWVITGLYSDSNFIRVLDTTKIHITFNAKENQLNGHGLCNNFHGPCFVANDSIRIGNIGSTKMLCEGVAFEGIITGMLQLMKRYEIKGWQLTLFGPENTTMVFKRRQLTAEDLKQE